MNKLPLIVVAGPTASGKTSLAIGLAKLVGGEIVSADSMQIYKYMDIGSAKPTEYERKQVKHHLIDFVEPDEEFSVADYTEAAHEVIRDILLRHKLPVMCGGTGLYINSVVDDVTFGETETDYALREELADYAKTHGNEAVLEMLKEIDPISAERLHPNNLRRIIRAIEFYRLTGTTISAHQEMTKQHEGRYDPIMFCIDYDRRILYDRINKRVDIMLEEGLLDEVKGLMERGYTTALNSMKAIGYKELIAYFSGGTSLDEAVELIKQSSRRYAKRQLTWFRRDKRIIWLDADGDVLHEAYEKVKKIYNL